MGAVAGLTTLVLGVSPCQCDKASLSSPGQVPPLLVTRPSSMDLLQSYADDSSSRSSHDGDQDNETNALSPSNSKITKDEDNVCCRDPSDQSTVLSRYHPSKRRRRGQVTVLDRDDQNVVVLPRLLFQRTQDHIRGNWAGHVYVVVQSRGHFEELYHHQAIDIWKDTLEQKMGWTGSMIRHAEWHLSLSKTFYLQHASILSFVKDLQEHLQYIPAAGRTARMVWKTLHVITNEERTRSFLTCPVVEQTTCTNAPATVGTQSSSNNNDNINRRKNTALQELIGVVDEILIKYGQPTYHDPPHYHVSLASIPDNILSPTDDSASIITTGIDHFTVIPIREVHCKFGTTQIYSFTLFNP